MLNWPSVTKLDLCFSGTESRVEILRLRRRFLKNQEKLSLIYARKGLVEQKREKVCIVFMNLIGQKYLFSIIGSI
jgi:hypothetical protein